MDAKTKKRLIAVGVLVPVLALAVASTPNSAPAVEPSDRQKAIAKFEDGPWLRNPFSIAAVPAAAAPAESGRPFLPTMKLEGIVWDEKSPYAIIDGELRTVGDVMEGFAIIHIDKDGVVFEKDGETYDIGLFPELK